MEILFKLIVRSITDGYVLPQWRADRDDRWEFDRVKLFGKTNYMVSLCDDIYNIAQVCVLFVCKCL